MGGREGGREGGGMIEEHVTGHGTRKMIENDPVRSRETT